MNRQWFNQQTLNKYLLGVDKSTHEIKKEYRYKPATGFTKGGKFASSIIVSLTQVAEGYLPIYTWVTPIFRGEKLDQDKRERLRFIKLIENGGLK